MNSIILKTMQCRNVKKITKVQGKATHIEISIKESQKKIKTLLGLQMQNANFFPSN